MAQSHSITWGSASLAPMLINHPNLTEFSKMFQQISKSASALFGKADYELSSPLIKQSIAEYADKVTQGKKKEKVRNSS